MFSRSGISMNKSALRRVLLAQRASLAGRVQRDQALARTLRLWLAQRNDRVIGAYWPIHGEFDPLPVLQERRLQTGVDSMEIALPVVVPQRRTLRFHAWQPGCAMAKNAYGIAEPQHTPRLQPSLLLVPALGYSACGWRLGYGGGFYDRTLADWHPKPFTAGLCYRCGHIHGFQADVHDVPLDTILTEEGVIWPL